MKPMVFHVHMDGGQSIRAAKLSEIVLTHHQLLYHAPLSAWAVGALMRGKLSAADALCLAYPVPDDPKVPIHLLIYACQTGITTMTCISEYLSWDSFTNEQKLSLSGLYVPYLALCKSSCSHHCFVKHRA